MAVVLTAWQLAVGSWQLVTTDGKKHGWEAGAVSFYLSVGDSLLAIGYCSVV